MVFSSKRFRVHVCPMLTDGRKDFRCDPTLEFLGCGKFAGQNQAVKARFIDNCGFLNAELGGDLPPSFFILINMGFQRVHGVLVPKHGSNILTDKLWFVVDFYRALCAL